MPEFNYAIGNILAKYPAISQGEDDILKLWIAENDTNKEIFESLTDNDSRIELLKEWDTINTPESEKWEKFQRRFEPVSNIEQSKTFHWWNRWPTYVAAASIIIIAAIGYKWLGGMQNDQAQAPKQKAQPTDVQPGGYKASLTLADGTVMPLDSFSKGQLVQQGGISVYSKGGELVYQGTQKGEVLYNTLSTGKGQMYVAMLSDGSKVWLNSQSSIRYPVAFNGDVRQVEISGEAYFEVAAAQNLKSQHKKVPFLVKAPGVDIQVLGTHFNINSYSNEQLVRTTLLEGKVKVQASNSSSIAVLQPGQEAGYDKQTGQIVKAEDADVDEAVAWKEGYFQFNGADLQTVLRQLVRWYNVDVAYKGEIPKRSFGGRISRKNSLLQVLTILESNGVHFNLQGNKIIVSL